ncbi:Beauvericin cluster-specific repressor BEA4, partial [Colletotrichum gloeosporioides]
RVKCDEQQPSCHRCVKIGVSCPGYGQRIKWSTKHERRPPQSSSATKSYIGVSNPSPLQPGADNADYVSTYTSSMRIAKKACERSSPVAHTRAVSLGDTSTPMRKSVGNETFTNLYTPTDRQSLMLNHYFVVICQVISNFDSAANPFRNEVSSMLDTSPLLYHCILSLSAAHLHQNDTGQANISLQYQTEAISNLSKQLAETSVVKSKEPDTTRVESSSTQISKSLTVKDDVLLGAILLGITSAWHDASSTGLPHLYGTRQLFKGWTSSNNLDHPDRRSDMTPVQTFLSSSMMYWEAMSSFIHDQNLDVLDYLEIFDQSSEASSVTPCPWTGVGSSVFLHLAKAGTLVRNKRALRSLDFVKNGEFHRQALHIDLLNEASSLEQAILSYELPVMYRVQDVGDPRTPPDHLLVIARCYQLSTLLEIYRAFPELATSNIVEDSGRLRKSGVEGSTQPDVVLQLALGILKRLRGIPASSGTVSTQTLPLLIAGSALRQSFASGAIGSQFPNTDMLHFREFVRTRVLHLYRTVGLRIIKHVAIILNEVWSLMDTMDSEGACIQREIHWIDVMCEMKLETMLG